MEDGQHLTPHTQFMILQALAQGVTDAQMAEAIRATFGLAFGDPLEVFPEKTSSGVIAPDCAGGALQLS